MTTTPRAIAVSEQIHHGDYQNTRYARVELTMEGVRAFIADSPYGKGLIGDAVVARVLDGLLADKKTGWGWAWVYPMRGCHAPILFAEGWTTQQVHEVGLATPQSQPFLDWSWMSADV